MRVLLLGGTSDARQLAYRLVDAGHAVELRTLTAYGKVLASDGHLSPAARGTLEVEAGPLDGPLLTERVGANDVVVDATHPFAIRISESAMESAQRAGKRFLRYERPGEEAWDRPGVHPVASHEEAARTAATLVGEQGVVLLTVGSRNLNAYASTPLPAGARWMARVLPDIDSLRACHEAGLSTGQIVALQGPVTEDLERAFLRHFGARVLVTKESGSQGGLRAKLAAALAEGVAVVLVERPRVAYPWVSHSMDAVLAEL